MKGCWLTELNPDLTRISATLINAALIGAIVALRSKISELRAKINNTAKVDVSGLPYQKGPNQQRVLSYKFALRLKILILASLCGVGAALCYGIIVTGDPKLLGNDLVCWGVFVLWISLLCTAVSVLIIADILLYFLRLHGAADEIK